MKIFLAILSLCVIGINCKSIISRVFGEVEPTDPRHACAILVFEQVEPGEPVARLGAGTIISDRHVLTAAHLVVGFARYEIGHGWTTGGSMLRRIATVANVFSAYNPTNFTDDLAIISLPVGQTFNLFTARLNAAILPEPVDDPEAAAAPTEAGLAIGWGFTAPGTNAMSARPWEADMASTGPELCLEFLPYDALDIHQACYAGTTAGVCPGDNGSGLYTSDEGPPKLATLIGIITLVSNTCASGGVALVQGFTSAHVNWMRDTANIPTTTVAPGP